MVSRAEVLRAHRFLRRRIVSAIESGRPDAEPNRRGAAVVVGVLVALLGVASVVARHYT